MSNLLDYVSWRGDIPLCKEAPFNVVDALVLTRLSYFPIASTGHTNRETVASFCKVFKTFPEDAFHIALDRELAEKLEQADRYKDLAVTDYVQSNEPSLEMQFSAVTILMPEDEIFISFCGTDGTFLGWKEDFNMSFQEDVPSQRAGLYYTNSILEKYPEKKVRIGGHSKGGNLSIYSAVCMPKEERKRLLGIYNFDGPGFSQHFLDTHDYESLVPLITTAIPENSVVGRILDHAEDFDVVKSSVTDLHQHDTYTWEVLGAKLVTLEKPSTASEITHESVRFLLEKTSPAQRKFFLDGLYGLLMAGDTMTVAEVPENFTKLLNLLFNEMMALSKEERKEVARIFQSFGVAYANAVREIGSRSLPEPLLELLSSEEPQTVLWKMISNRTWNPPKDN